jgi:hypothetical protein
MSQLGEPQVAVVGAAEPSSVEDAAGRTPRVITIHVRELVAVACDYRADPG